MAVDLRVLAKTAQETAGRPSLAVEAEGLNSTLRHIGRLHRRPIRNSPLKKSDNHRSKQWSYRYWSRTPRRATAARACPALMNRSQASGSCSSNQGSRSHSFVRIVPRRPDCKSLREKELPGTPSRVRSRWAWIDLHFLLRHDFPRPSCRRSDESRRRSRRGQERRQRPSRFAHLA
jgi:hypothetical protein